jgi:hypothetical protein
MDAVAGPVEWVAIEFDGTQLDPRVVPPLAALVDAGTVRLLDAAVVHKEADGQVRGAELADEMIAFDPVPGEVLELLSEEDLERIAEDIPVGTTTLVLVWENRWAAAFAAGVRGASGRMVSYERVPRDAVERAFAAIDGTGPEPVDGSARVGAEGIR